MTTILATKFNNPKVPKKIRRVANEIRHDVCQVAPGGWVAGGALRSRIANDGASDWDCYFKNSSDLNTAYQQIKNNSDLYVKTILEDESLITVQLINYGKVDLVKKYFNSPSECLKDFDFTVCCFALDHRGEVYWTREALEDLNNKRLILYHVSCPFSTTLRLQKYAVKGYFMDVENHKKLADMMKEADMSKTFNKIVKRGNTYAVYSENPAYEKNRENSAKIIGYAGYTKEKNINKINDLVDLIS